MSDSATEITADCSNADIALVRRAARERWPIAEEKRGLIAEAMATIALDLSREDRSRVSAAKTLEAMDRLNLEQEKRDLQIPDYHAHTITGQIEVLASALVKVYGRKPAPAGSPDRVPDGGS